MSQPVRRAGRPRRPARCQPPRLGLAVEATGGVGDEGGGPLVDLGRRGLELAGAPVGAGQGGVGLPSLPEPGQAEVGGELRPAVEDRIAVGVGVAGQGTAVAGDLARVTRRSSAAVTVTVPSLVRRRKKSCSSTATVAASRTRRRSSSRGVVARPRRAALFGSRPCRPGPAALSAAARPGPGGSGLRGPGRRLGRAGSRCGPSRCAGPGGPGWRRCECGRCRGAWRSTAPPVASPSGARPTSAMTWRGDVGATAGRS